MAPEAQVDTTNPAATKLVPVMVTATVEPSGACTGVIEVIVAGDPPPAAPAVLICHMGPASAAKRWPWPSKASPAMLLNAVGTPAISPVSAIVERALAIGSNRKIFLPSPMYTLTPSEVTAK